MLKSRLKKHYEIVAKKNVAKIIRYRDKHKQDKTYLEVFKTQRFSVYIFVLIGACISLKPSLRAINTLGYMPNGLLQVVLPITLLWFAISITTIYMFSEDMATHAELLKLDDSKSYEKGE